MARFLFFSQPFEREKMGKSGKEYKFRQQNRDAKRDQRKGWLYSSQKSQPKDRKAA